MSEQLTAPTPSRLVRVARTLRTEAWAAVRNTYVNEIAGSHLVPSLLRAVLYRSAGARIDAAYVSPRCRIDGSPRNLHLGHRTYLNAACYLETVGQITIGAHCAVGMEAMLVTSSHPIDAHGRWSPASIGRPVRIGDRVWIGARAMVMPGVTIGNDVVIAAGAVVTKDCGAGGLYAGIPARRIRDLIPPDGVA